MSLYEILKISPRQMDEIVDEICDDIISHRKGEMYDEIEDPYEATDDYFVDFLGDIRYLVDKKMEENFVDENYDIIG